MPNHITNKLKINADEKLIKEQFNQMKYNELYALIRAGLVEIFEENKIY